MKKIRVLFLGAAFHQIPAIQEAKNRGYYIITCDYLPQNPGHKYADEYHNINTTDFYGVLELAQKVKPDFIIAHATDAAAEIVSKVSEKLGLPCNSSESVRILANKALFRKFQNEHFFNSPRAIPISLNDNRIEKTDTLSLPLIVKPADASGSKGVSIVTLKSEVQQAVDYAFTFSRSKQVIAEEYIECAGAQLHGDGFVKDGRLVFSCMGDHYYNFEINPFVPYATTWPSIRPKEIIGKVEAEINRLIQEVGYMNGTVNLEVRINKEGKIFIGEIAPRSGSNLTAKGIFYATGFDMVKALLDVHAGKNPVIETGDLQFAANYVLHSGTQGILKKLTIQEDVKPFVKEFHQLVHIGEKVASYQNSTAAIGLLLLQFDEREKMDYYVGNMSKFINLEIFPE